MTTEQVARYARSLSNQAGEPVTVEKIKGVYYAYGSELACLRLFAVYNSNGAAPNARVRVGYSENLGTWYLSLEAFS